MLDLILKLIKAITDGFSFFQKNQQDLYNNFISPALIDFEVVHQNYLTTFKKYESIIDKSKVPLSSPNHPVKKELFEDALYSDNIRSKILSLNLLEDDLLFGGVSKALVDYFNFTNGNPEHYINNVNDDKEALTRSNIMNLLGNKVRIEVLRKLDVSDKVDKLTAIYNLQETLAILQIKYKAVINEFQALKVKLLKT